MLDKIKSRVAPLVKKTKKAGNTNQYVVALDIGTEFVKALVAQLLPDGTLEVLGVGREHQNLSDMQAGAIADITAVVTNCDQALSKAEKQAGVSVRTAVIGIAGELVKGTTTTIRCNRKVPDKAMDIPEVERIISLVQERAAEKAKQELAYELGGKEVDIRLVNSALVSIEIDGYPVTNPIGFQGKQVDVELYTAFAPMLHIGALEKTAQELDLDLAAVAAEPFAVSRSVIGDNPNASLSAILMDVGGGTTDIAVVNDGGVQGTKMFGIGGRAFTKAVERELGVDYETAEKFKVGLSDNSTPVSRRTAVEAALNKTLDVWIRGVELALSEFTKLDHLPNRLLLCGGGSSLDLLTHRLEQTKWYLELPFTKKPVIQHIKPDETVGITDKTGAITDHTFITALGLLRVGADTLSQQMSENSASFRQRIDKILRV